MIIDGMKEMTLGKFAGKCKETLCHYTKPHSPRSNSTEREIRELEKGAVMKLTHSGLPRQLWCFALEYKFKTADISPFSECGFWDRVKFWDSGIAFPGDPLVIVNYLGPSIVVGPAMTQCMMKVKSEGEDCSTIQLLTPEECLSDGMHQKQEHFVIVPGGNSHKLAQVVHQKHDINGALIGTAHKQPALDTCVYELAVNVIAETLYAQCETDGNEYVLLDSAVNYQCNIDVAVPRHDQVKVMDDKQVVTHSTKVGSCAMHGRIAAPLGKSYLKKLHPLQVAKFAHSMGIADEPAFNWCVPWVLKKRDQIVSLVKHQSTWCQKQTHKFGIEIPKSVDEAYTINATTGALLWQAAIEKEIQYVCVANDILKDGTAMPPDHWFMCCHVIFDVKMEDFCRKAQLVTRGQMPQTAAMLTYASIVSRETIRIALLLAAQNDGDV
ncbi:LOW QUALITY PROTEIN: hypothetical protein ACHAW6_014650 [Cyclotella cf. meneghiniana]